MIIEARTHCAKVVAIKMTPGMARGLGELLRGCRKPGSGLHMKRGRPPHPTFPPSTRG